MKLIAWEFRDCAPGEAGPSDAAPDWHPITAPGDVYVALHTAGRLSHPYREQNESEYAWAEHREWWWRTSFVTAAAAGGERVMLVFEGLDTFADIWLNGALLGSSSNMFAGRTFDITSRILAGESNELRICFTPPAKRLADKEALFWDVPDDHPINGSKRNLMRKAQFGWGWDWAPSFPTVGIWRPVRLERQTIAAIRDVRFETIAIGGAARVAVTVDVDAFAGCGSVSTELCDPAGVKVASAQCAGRSEWEIPEPQLWWTPELGVPALYTLTTTLTANGHELDRREQKVGIRTIELDTAPDPAEPGCDFFRFVLNGVPIFARGANWLPTSSFVGAVTQADYDRLLDQAVGANMNMLRVWGGGVYEQSGFYEACDRRGLLVWQDFMFACSPYPEDDPVFDAEVAAEIEWQVTRLRNHPSLALWCGNNEGQLIQEIMNHRRGEALPYIGDRHFQGTIPELLAALDPGTPYWPGSPSGGPAHNSMRAGDVHNWTVWHGLPPVADDVVDGEFDRTPEGVAYTRYAEDRGRFVSEFGLMSAPAFATLGRWMATDQLTLGSPGLINRIKDRPIDKIEGLLEPNTGLPNTLQEYVDFSQVVQAEGLKFGIEHYRRRKPHCSGTLLWQLNDCWPGVSWSIIDGDGVAKPAWYAVRRAFAPVMASFRDVGDGSIELWVTNDTLADIPITGTIKVVTMRGDTVQNEQLLGMAFGNSSQIIWRGKPPTAVDHVLIVRSEAFPDNRYFFAPLKALPLQSDVNVEIGGDCIVMTARQYSFGIGVYADGATTLFSDNFFDLAAGERRTVRILGATPASVTVRPSYGSNGGSAGLQMEGFE